MIFLPEISNNQGKEYFGYFGGDEGFHVDMISTATYGKVGKTESPDVRKLGSPEAVSLFTLFLPDLRTCRLPVSSAGTTIHPGWMHY